MAVLIRFADGREEALELDELKARIVVGQLPAATVVKNKFLTNDEWKALNETEYFHRHSPVKYPPGPELFTRRQAEALAAENALRVRRLLEEVPPLKERLGLRRLVDLTKDHAGPSARLFVFPAFDDPTVMTVVRGSQLHFEMLSFQPNDDEIRRRAASLARLEEDWPVGSQFSVTQCPAYCGVLSGTTADRAADAIVQEAPRAPSCSTLTLDGVSYIHEFHDHSGEECVAEWRNPHGPQHEAQLRMVAAYSRLAKAANVRWNW